MNKDSQFSCFNPPIYKKDQTPSSISTIELVHKEIQGYKLKWKTHKIRECETAKERKQLKQKYLPYVTFAGTFSYRNNESLIKRSGLIVIDIDHLTPYKIQETKESIINKIQPVLLFISPSDGGLKIVYCIDTALPHLSYYEALKAYFQQTLSLSIDGGSDISRTCFLCYDPNVFLSVTPDTIDKTFLNRYQPLKTLSTNHWTSKKQKVLVPEEIYRRAKVWVEKQATFTEGTRNHYVFTLAGACHRMGLTEDETLKFVSEYQQKGSPIKSVVQSIYKNNTYRNVAPFIKHSQP